MHLAVVVGNREIERLDVAKFEFFDVRRQNFVSERYRLDAVNAPVRLDEFGEEFGIKPEIGPDVNDVAARPREMADDLQVRLAVLGGGAQGLGVMNFLEVLQHAVGQKTKGQPLDGSRQHNVTP